MYDTQRNRFGLGFELLLEEGDLAAYIAAILPGGSHTVHIYCLDVRFPALLLTNATQSKIILCIGDWPVISKAEIKSHTSLYIW